MRWHKSLILRPVHVKGLYYQVPHTGRGLLDHNPDEPLVIQKLPTAHSVAEVRLRAVGRIGVAQGGSKATARHNAAAPRAPPWPALEDHGGEGAGTGGLQRRQAPGNATTHHEDTDTAPFPIHTAHPV